MEKIEKGSKGQIQKWTPDEFEKLLQMLKQGFTLEEMQENLGRRMQ